MQSDEQRMLMSVPASDLRAVLPFKGYEDVRYYLNGIHIEPASTGCVVVATNGHVLAALHSAEAYIDRPRILAVTRGLEKELMDTADILRAVEVETETSRTVLRSNTREYYIQPDKPFVDGKYPDWRHVIPEAEHLAPGLLAPIAGDYVTKIWTGIRRSSSRYDTAIHFFHDKRDPKSKAIIARPQSHPDMVVAIMPMSGEWTPQWPEWLRKPETLELERKLA